MTPSERALLVAVAKLLAAMSIEQAPPMSNVKARMDLMFALGVVMEEDLTKA